VIPSMPYERRSSAGTSLRAGQRDWKLDGACTEHDPDLFFPAGESQAFRPQIEEAKAICRACPVLATCQGHALAVREPYGIWGALDEEERRRIHRNEQRRLAKAIARATDNTETARRSA
jgi:WhiB family redox-sensing transcriptional regulator